MKQTLLATSICLVVCGCSGLELRAMEPKEVNGLFGGGNRTAGYVIYEPMVVVEISDETPCLKKEGEKCIEKGAPKCTVGAPIYLPNYERPYIVNSKSGFGKAGVDVAINNGWQIGAIKDNSDNSSLLPFVTSVTGTYADGEKAAGCKEPGLYRLISIDNKPEGQRVKLEKLKGYLD